MGWSEKPDYMFTTTQIFCVGKANLSKGCWDPKRELGVPIYFSEMIKSGNPEISPGGVQNEKNRKFPNFART